MLNCEIWLDKKSRRVRKEIFLNVWSLLLQKILSVIKLFLHELVEIVLSDLKFLKEFRRSMLVIRNCNSFHHLENVSKSGS